ncbi:MAG: alpha/beta hydrolase [Actinomycetota bacterium]|nr:alpha/beta hydrolase [Actinomycetota bacterium]
MAALIACGIRRVTSPAAGSGRRRVAVFVLAVPLILALAGCTLPAPAGVAPLRYRDAIFSNFTETDGIPYATAPDASGTTQSWSLDMYTPTGDTQTSRPGIVLVHGGGFRGGNSKNGAMVTLAKAFAQRGYVAVSINYPLLAGTDICSKDPTPTQTCINAAFAAQHAAQAAARYLRANTTRYGVDPTRIAVEGGSAGAVTALAVAVNSGDPGTDGNPGYSSQVQAAMAISGELPHSFADLYDPSDAPVLMFNGTADQTVPFAKGAQTAADLQTAGVPIVFEPLQGAGHVPFNTDGDTLVTQSVYFAYYFMHLDQAAGQPASAARLMKAQEARFAQEPAVRALLKRQAAWYARHQHQVKHHRRHIPTTH